MTFPPKFKSLIPALVLSVCLATGCGKFYDFKGISIPAEVNTFVVEPFVFLDAQCQAGMEVIVSEKLRAVIRNQSRLVNNEEDPDISFSGQVSSCSTTYVAPTEGSTTSLNRYEISIKVIYQNNRDEEDKWSKNYSAFQDFDSNGDFQSLQDDLIETILNDIIDRVFNDSFTNW